MNSGPYYARELPRPTALYRRGSVNMTDRAGALGLQLCPGASSLSRIASACTMGRINRPSGGPLFADGPCGLAEKVRDPGPEAPPPRRDPEARELAGAGRPSGTASAHGNPPFDGSKFRIDFFAVVREGSGGPFSSLTWPKTAFLMKNRVFSEKPSKKAQNRPKKISDGIPNVPHPRS